VTKSIPCTRRGVSQHIRCNMTRVGQQHHRHAATAHVDLDRTAATAAAIAAAAAAAAAVTIRFDCARAHWQWMFGSVDTNPPLVRRILITRTIVKCHIAPRSYQKHI
jgi:hypothetical protein